MKINWHTISQQTFLNDYWQKQPVVLKAAISNFQDPIEPEELAGLAMEEFVDSRIVSNYDDQWQLKQGPFKDFDGLGEEHWSLLVQGVDNYYPGVQAMLNAVDFIPKWRIDDVMVSFSTPKGGVGPHLDQYDVFIVQGMGQRRWRAGTVDRTLVQNETSPNLLQLEGFDATLDEILEPGDILYIPPFSPHSGETLTPALNYSIGFRAPSSQELLSAFADYTIDNELGMDRFKDTQLDDKEKSFSPSKLELNQLKHQMLKLIEQPGRFERFINQKLTIATRELDLVQPLEIATEKNILSLFDKYGAANKVLGLKSCLIKVENNHYFMCSGEEFKVVESQLEFIEQLSEHSSLTKETLNSSLKCVENRQLFTTLINQGFWYFND